MMDKAILCRSTMERQKAVMVRRSGGYSDFSVGDNDLVYVRYLFLNFPTQKLQQYLRFTKKIW